MRNQPIARRLGDRLEKRNARLIIEPDRKERGIMGRGSFLHSKFDFFSRDHSKGGLPAARRTASVGRSENFRKGMMESRKTHPGVSEIQADDGTNQTLHQRFLLGYHFITSVNSISSARI